MNDKHDPEEELARAKDSLRLEEIYRIGWLVALIICTPLGLYLIGVANSTEGGAAEAYGIICFFLLFAAGTAAAAVMVLTFGVMPHSRQVVRRCQREYDKYLVREAGL